MSLAAPPYDGWPSSARALVENACVRYGGREHWARTRISFSCRTLWGLIPALKGFGATFEWPATFHIEPRRGRVVFDALPDSGGSGLYDRGVVSLVDGDQRERGKVSDLRASFRGLHKLARWSQLDAFYFFGYALTHYHSVPFTLGEARFLQHTRWRGLETISLELPKELHTHSRQQTFYFDAEGLIRRHDYVAEIVGGWAHGAHFWRDYVYVDGFPVAQVRHVVARLGRIPLPFTALHAEIEDVRVVASGEAP